MPSRFFVYYETFSFTLQNSPVEINSWRLTASTDGTCGRLLTSNFEGTMLSKQITANAQLANLLAIQILASFK